MKINKMQLAKYLFAVFLALVLTACGGSGGGDNNSESDNESSEVLYGSLTVSLTWDTAADLDLYLEEPNGHTISHRSQASSAGDGLLDLDDTDGYGPETIAYDLDIPAGSYTASVRVSAGEWADLPVDYTVIVDTGRGSNSHSGTLTDFDEEQVAVSFVHEGFTAGSGSNGGSDTDTDTGSGSGFGNLVIYLGQGRLVPRGESLSDCGGSYEFRLMSGPVLSGTIVASEYASQTMSPDDVFCGVYGAATFLSIPEGEYNLEKWCPATGRKIGTTLSARIVEDECRTKEG